MEEKQISKQTNISSSRGTDVETEKSQEDLLFDPVVGCLHRNST